MEGDMKTNARLHRHWAVRRFSLLGIVSVVILSSVFAFPSPIAGRGERVPLDLAAMALTSADINDADLVWQGSRDYGLLTSVMMADLDDYLLHAIQYRTADDDELEHVLDDAGFVRSYQAFYMPMTTADGDDSRLIFSYVVEFADEAGAADAFAFMQDESSADEATDVNSLDQYGDESEGTLAIGEGVDTGEFVGAVLDTTVLLNRLHVGVLILDVGGAEPDVDDAAKLTEAMLGRVEAALDEPAWGLSNQVVRLTGESVSSDADAYLLRDGEVTLLARDNIEDEDELEDWYAEIGQTGEYRVWQRLVPENDGPDDNAMYYLTVHQFEDNEAANAWMTARPDAIEDYGAFEDVEFADEDDVDVGDAAFSYTAVSTSTGTHFHNITFQFGILIVVLDLSGPTTPPAEALLALADTQWTCLETQNCLEPAELPDALQGFLDDIDPAR
jgi:hypothetical protein